MQNGQTFFCKPKNPGRSGREGHHVFAINLCRAGIEGRAGLCCIACTKNRVLPAAATGNVAVGANGKEHIAV